MNVKQISNLASIGNVILFKPGEIQAIKSSNGRIIAAATLEEPIETEFGIYDLPSLVNVLKGFPEEDLEIEYNENNLLIKSIATGAKIKYGYAEPEIVKPRVPPANLMTKTFEVVDEYTLSESDFDRLRKLSGILRLDKMLFKKNSIEIKNVEQSNSNVITIPVASNPDIDDYEFTVDVSELSGMVKSEYNVQVCNPGLIRFDSETEKMTYFVTMDRKK